MSEKDLKVKEKNESSPLVRWGIYIGVLLIVFLLGLVPMMVRNWSVQGELAETQKQLRQAQVKDMLTTSVIEAKRGEYETARQKTSNFYTQLRIEEEKGDDGFLTEQERGQMKPVFDARDAVITMLAQRDPASVERLTGIYSTYLQALGVPQPATTTATPAEAPPPTE